jgi:hypothetical protein
MMADSMRSINSFGVAGLLAQSGDVFYTNDLRARNIGRVSDLLSAKLRETNVDELRIRALLTYGIFETYALRGLENHHKEEIHPASLEIGIDSIHIVVAISFHWDGNKTPNWKGLETRVDAGKSGDAFEKTLEWIALHSAQVIVRYELKDRRIEIVSILNRLEGGMRDPTMVVAVDSKTAPLLEVSNYVELGDLNFSKLLRNPVATEEVGIDSDGRDEESVRVVSGGPNSDTVHEKRFAASKDEIDAKALQEIREEYESTVSELKNTVHQLKERLESAENEASERRFTGDPAVADEEPIVVKGSEEKTKKKEDDWGIHFLKQVWPFAPKEEKTKKPEEESTTVIAGQEIDSRNEIVEPLPDALTIGDDGNPIEPTETEKATDAALQALQELAKTHKTKKIEATLHEIEEEVEPHKAKRWVDSLSSDILQEKAKLNELQRNLTKQMRQRELEFKTSERALKQELKRKEELIYQRQASIDNKNDQIAQLNLAVERAAAGTVDKESQQVKVKLERAQRLAQMKEEETKTLITKVRDLENRLIISQAKSQKGNDLQMATKVQTLEKKVDEYKRINQRLMESLNSQKEKTNDKEVGDLRRKIDQLDRLNTESKRSLEKTAFKVRELQESEKKLQTDLARAVEENRNLRKNNSPRGSGESGGGQAA